MQQTGDQAIIDIIAASIILLVLVAFIFSFLLYYQRKHNRYIEETQQMQREFQHQLLQSQLEIQELTFNYISQEIHDNVGQILSLAKVQINIMTESENINKEILGEVKENVGKAMADLRDIAKSLSSERIRTTGIYETVTNEAIRINKSDILQLTVSKNGDEQKMDEQKKLILFRIIQESLQNSIKHADASQVDILFNYLPENLYVCIKDNGKGFNMEDAVKKIQG